MAVMGFILGGMDAIKEEISNKLGGEAASYKELLLEIVVDEVEKQED